MNTLNSGSFVRRLVTVAAIAICASCRPPLDNTNPETTRNSSSHADAAEVGKIFDAMVTTNPRPEYVRFPSGGHVLKFPTTFDWKEQTRVVAAIKQLEKVAEDAWPQIVDHMTDEDYCVSAELFGSPFTLSRGRVCYHLASNWLNETYCGLMPMDSERYNFGPPASDAKELQKWCKERRGKSLAELQIDAGQWAISIIPTESIESKEEQEFAISAIKDRIAKLRESKTPTAATFFTHERATH
jgi:hypothetical protein